MSGTKRKETDALPSEKKHRKAITLEEKMAIIKKFENGVGITEIGKVLNYSKSTVNTIVKQKEKYIKTVQSCATMSSKRLKPPGSIMTEMEKLLILFIEHQIDMNAPISQKIIQAKAKSLFDDIKKKRESLISRPVEETSTSSHRPTEASISRPTEASTSGSRPTTEASTSSSRVAAEETFTASQGWFEKFKKRANLHSIKITGEAASANNEAAKEYPAILEKIIQDGGFSSKQVINVDETMVYWKRMLIRTFINKDKKVMPGFKTAKDRFTLLLGGNCEGDFKLKPLLIYKSLNPCDFAGHPHNQLPVVWKANKKAWVTADVFKDWALHHFIPEFKDYCHKNNLDFKALIVLDNAPGHPQSLASTPIHPNVKIVFLPPNTTSLIQPMDQGAIATFKSYYHTMAYKQLIDATAEEGELTISDFWKKYNVLHAIRNVDSAWKKVTQKCMNGIWRNLCPQFIHDFDGFEAPSVVINNNIEELVQIERDDITISQEDIREVLESSDIELSNEELMSMSEEGAKHRLGDESEEETSNVPEKSLTPKVLNEGLQDAIDYLHENDPDTARSSAVSRSAKKSFACNYEIRERMKPKQIPDFEDRLSSCEGSKGDGASGSYLSCASSIPSIVEDSGEPGLLKNAMGCGDDRSYYSEDDIIGVKSELSFPPDIEIDEENVVENTRSSSPVSRTASPTSSGMTGPYLLKKETHCSSILDELLKDDTFTDVTLSAEGQHIRAHRIILCLSSKYFKEVLSKESSAKNVIFFRDIKYDELKNLITFIYTGEVTVDAADLESFMKTAELLEVTSLCEGHKNFPKGFPLSKNSTGVSKPTTSSSKRTNSSLATHSPPSKTRKITSTTETPAQCKPRRKRSNAFSTPSTPVTVKSEPITADSEDEDDLKEETVETSSTFIDVGHLSSEDEIGLASAARLAQGLTPEKLESTADATQVTNVTVTPGRCPFCSPTRQLYIGPIMLTHLQISHPDETAYPCDNCYSVFINKISFLAHHKECKR